MKQIIFDIDNTLIFDNHYPQNLCSIKNLIKELSQQNYQFNLCTNRGLENSVKQLYNDYCLNGIIIAECGTCCYSQNFELLDNFDCFDLNKQLLQLFNDYAINNNCEISTKIVYDYSSSPQTIQINGYRKFSSTILFPQKYQNKILSIKKYLTNCLKPLNYIVEQSQQNKNKLFISKRNVNKYFAMEKYLPNQELIFITDKEPFVPTKNIKTFSVGTDMDFNRYCDMVLSPNGKGIENFLRSLKEKCMKEYEVLSENCKIAWCEGFETTTEKHTQVSGYIFNDKNQLLIVKNGKSWTVPGGHPEPNETKQQTLEREVMEEACVKLKNIVYIGAVEVVENGETYYQLRYTAKAAEVLEFVKEWETDERLFVDLDDLPNYIKWCKGVTFAAQIESAKKVWEK